MFVPAYSLSFSLCVCVCELRVRETEGERQRERDNSFSFFLSTLSKTKMVSPQPQQQPCRKLRALCLHGFRTSARILEQQLLRWPAPVLDHFDLTFLDGPCPCGGKSDVEGIFPPPYFEWFQFNSVYAEFFGIEESISFISNFMEKNGPFDGLIGFSQGAVLSAAIAGLQQNGLTLTRHPPLRFVIIISGAKFKHEPFVHNCYSETIRTPSVHLIGENDWFKPRNEEVLLVFENPVVIRHGAKHIVPRLGEEAAATMTNFLLRILRSWEKDRHDDVMSAAAIDHGEKEIQLEMLDEEEVAA